MKIGFTGSSTTITEAQVDALQGLLVKLDTSEFHHGDCIVADVTAAELVHKLGIYIVCHPPKNSYKAAFTDFNNESRSPLHYMDRNKNIVNETEILIAVPDGPEKVRSGTWSTVRYARKLSKEIYIIHSDGSIEYESATNPDRKTCRKL